MIQALSVKIIKAQTASGPVGIEYMIYEPYSEDSAYTEKFNIGGFTGHIKTASYFCVSSPS